MDIGVSWFCLDGRSLLALIQRTSALRAISHVTRGDNETARVHLTGRTEVPPVSRGYLHVFRPM
jgi:hypothetical protein